MNLLETKELMRLSLSLVPLGRRVRKVTFAELEATLRTSCALADIPEPLLRKYISTIYPVYKNNRRRAKIIKIDLNAAHATLDRHGIFFRELESYVGARVV